MSLIQKLAAHFATIQDIALCAHESLERSGRVALNDLESGILGSNRCYDKETRASMLWSFLIFTTPRLTLQAEFQNEISKHVTDSETALIMRQIRNRAPRIWSYRRTYDNGFAHVIAGPGKHNEIALEGCVWADGRICESEHIYAFGWTLSFHDKIYLVCADEMSQEQAWNVENIRTFPMQLHDDDFWEESFMGILDLLYEPMPILNLSARITSEPTSYAPERLYAKLQRILASELTPAVVRNVSSLQELVATHESGEITEYIESIIKRQPSMTPETAEYLKRRLLEAVGCDETGEMPSAHVSILAADPIALLGLPEDHPIFKFLGLRDSIRQALAHEEQLQTHDISEAFQIYQHERRWISSFACFDLTNEEHAARFGIPVDAIRHVFSPEILTACLPIVPQGDTLRQLQSKFNMYQPDEPPPSFEDVLKALNTRQFTRTGNMSAIAQWVMSCCDRWRYCRTQIDPETVGAPRHINHHNQKLLHKGLTQLADLFKKN